MDIRKVKWKGHPVLGNLELDFTNRATDTPFKTILFAGENGAGKTTILSSISTFLNKGTFEFFEYIEYVVDSQDWKAIPIEGGRSQNDYDRINPNGEKERIITIQDEIDEDVYDIRHCGCILSKARSDFKTEKIKSTTAKELDVDKYDVDEKDSFTSLKQLIIDIQGQDDGDYSRINRTRGCQPMSYDDFYPNSKIYRFSHAFNNFFEKLEYSEIKDEGGEKKILFKKNSSLISIDDLSTGEKQIVFRGIYLLKNAKILNGSTIMVDEPELSMHPKWQSKILQYYKQLFTNDENQKAQLFFATHSELVLKEALSNKEDNLVVILKDVGGVIESKRVDAPSVLSTITSAETNYLAFDVVTIDYHIQLYGYLQAKERKRKVKECDDFIMAHESYSGNIHEKDYNHPNGRTVYKTLPTYIRNCIDHPDSRYFNEEELRKSIELLIRLCNYGQTPTCAVK